MPARRKPCGWTTCVALAAPGHEFCPVHHPEAVQTRIMNIIEDHRPMLITNVWTGMKSLLDAIKGTV